MLLYTISYHSEKVRLIRRFGRFKGYGFVSFKNQDISEIVSQWNGKLIGTREIKVQPAEPPKPAAPAAEGQSEPKPARKPRGPKKDKPKVPLLFLIEAS